MCSFAFSEGEFGLECSRYLTRSTFCHFHQKPSGKDFQNEFQEQTCFVHTASRRACRGCRSMPWTQMSSLFRLLYVDNTDDCLLQLNPALKTKFIRQGLLCSCECFLDKRSCQRSECDVDRYRISAKHHLRRVARGEAPKL